MPLSVKRFWSSKFAFGQRCCAPILVTRRRRLRLVRNQICLTVCDHLLVVMFARLVLVFVLISTDYFLYTLIGNRFFAFVRVCLVDLI